MCSFALKANTTGLKAEINFSYLTKCLPVCAVKIPAKKLAYSNSSFWLGTRFHDMVIKTMYFPNQL